MLRSIAFTLFLYLLLTTLIFGDPFQPLGLLFLWSDRLGAPGWRFLVALSFIIAAVIAFMPARLGVTWPYKAPTFTAVALLGSVLSVGLYADRIRRIEIAAFNPDRQFQHSLLRSLSKAPSEFQFFLHAAVLKDCVPYAWSYSTMAFYRLPADVAVNVLPETWITSCAIKRSRER